jgi:hypothetical protein
MAVQCWASCLGNCSPVQSREHYISKGLFDTDSVRVVGLPWCKTEEKAIGVASAVAKILCKTHNEALSPLDTEAIKLFDCVREWSRLREVRATLPPGALRVRERRIDGLLVERWFLKTLVNMVKVQTQEMFWSGTAIAREPGREVIEACFGLAPIVAPRGLHAAAAPGQPVNSRDSVSFTAINDTITNSVGGGLFEFRGLRFAFAWTKRSLEPFVIALANAKPEFVGWRASSLLRHSQGAIFQVGSRNALRLKVVWPPFAPVAAP